MVGLSGGKDSWALLQYRRVAAARAVRFSLVAVNVDSGYKEYKHDLIARTCRRGWERIEHTGIASSSTFRRRPDALLAVRAASRGVLYRIAKESGGKSPSAITPTFIETLLLNCSSPAPSRHAGKARVDNGQHVVIRPWYTWAKTRRAPTQRARATIVGCCACLRDLGLQRQRAKPLMELEREHPGVKQSMLKALANVAPRHLLDTRLNPPAELRATASSRQTDGVSELIFQARPPA